MIRVFCFEARVELMVDDGGFEVCFWFLCVCLMDEKSNLILGFCSSFIGLVEGSSWHGGCVLMGAGHGGSVK